MKKITLLVFTLFLSSVGYSLPFGDCLKWSKDPRCWDPAYKLPMKKICLPKTSCSKIDFIQRDNSEFRCASLTMPNFRFNCTELVRTYGVKILHQPVLLYVETTDTCHIPGLCGQRACYPVGIATAYLNLSSCNKMSKISN